MKTAIVHDWIVTPAGAEKALESIYRVFPSPIHTMVYKEETVRASPVLRDAEVHASFLQRLPRATTWYRNYLPLYPRAVESLDVSGAELIISSSHAAAKGVRKRPGQLHICYCYTPMRYAWDLHDQYMAGLDPLRRAAATVVLERLRRWDVQTAAGVDHFVAISEHVAGRIRRIYGREAAVIHPPVDTERFQPAGPKASHFVTVSRLVPYKRVDMIADAFTALGLPLVIVGDGPERARVAAAAGQNVTLTGPLPAEQVRRLVATARAFVFAAEEDFGIAPVEALACGTPVIGFGRGGLVETVTDGVHGILYKEQTPGSLCCAVESFLRFEGRFQPSELRRQAERFSRPRFEAEFKAFVERKWNEFRGTANTEVRPPEAEMVAALGGIP